MSRGIAKGRRPDLVGGGLIRSAGGWFEVLALRRSGNKQASDQRILGDGEFVQGILEEVDEIGGRSLRMPHDKMKLDSLAEKVSEVHGVRIGELRSGSRCPSPKFASIGPNGSPIPIRPLNSLQA